MRIEVALLAILPITSSFLTCLPSSSIFRTPDPRDCLNVIQKVAVLASHWTTPIHWTYRVTRPGEIGVPAIWSSDTHYGPLGCRIAVVFVFPTVEDDFGLWDVGALAVSLYEHCMVERGPGPGFARVRPAFDRTRVYLYAVKLAVEGFEGLRNGSVFDGGWNATVDEKLGVS